MGAGRFERIEVVGIDIVELLKQELLSSFDLSTVGLVVVLDLSDLLRQYFFHLAQEILLL